MKWFSFILAFSLVPLTVFGQDLESLLNSSLRILQDPVSFTNSMSCFDYRAELPKIVKTKEGPRCADKFQKLAVGKNRLNNQNNYSSGNYLLSRTSEKNYQVILNLNFVPDANPYRGRAGDEALANQLLQRTRNCLKEMKPYLRGPNGEELEVLVLTDKDPLPFGMQKPRASSIKVSYQNSEFRGDASNFGSSFECTAIGHEVLHHLGLCDEYNEGVIHTPGYPPADWSCRPVTAANSYMRNMNFAFETTLPLTSRCECDSNCRKIMEEGGKARSIFLSMNGQEIMGSESSLMVGNDHLNPNREICKMSNAEVLDASKVPSKAFEFESQNGNVYKFNSYRVFGGDKIFYDKVTYRCECKPHQLYCHKLLNKMKQIARNVPDRSTCPDFVKPRSTGPSIGYDEGGTRVECQSIKEKSNCDLVISSRGTGKSLLAPAHFNRIIGGDCKGSSPNYEKCQEYAYMSGSDPECKMMPKECLDDSYYLGVSDQ